MTTERNISIDALKLCMAVMVVGLHGNLLSEYSPLLSHLLRNGLFRIAVPTFLVISGYFFAATTQTTTQRLHWLGRIVVLYALWMAIYAPLWFHLDESAQHLILIAGFGYYHLWYIAGLIGAGALLSLISPLRSSLILIVAIALFLIGVFIQYASVFDFFSGPVHAIVSRAISHRNFLFFSLPFFALGFLIKRTGFDERVSSRAAFGLALIGLCLLLLESYATYLVSDEEVDNFLSLVLAAPALFLATRKLKIQGVAGKQISLLAAGIYFTHVMLLVGLDLGHRLPPTIASLAALLGSVLLTLLMMRSRTLVKWLL